MMETSPVFEKIKFLLDENRIPYQLFEHEPVFTSEQAAAVRGTNQKQGAKAMIFNADPAPEQVRCVAGKKPILIVVPGDKKVDTKKFKKTYHIKDLRLLSAEEVKELTGLEIGAIPPFGSVINLTTYLDEQIVRNEMMAFNVGSHTRSVQMIPRDFLQLEKPVIGQFAV